MSEQCATSTHKSAFYVLLSSPSSATAKKGIFLESAEGARSGASDFEGFLIARLGVAILVACSSFGTGA